MKETIGKLTIRYLGFESIADGSRRLTFFVTTSGHEPSHVTFDIPSRAFIGEQKISFQESAAVCYEKLKHLVEREDGVRDKGHFKLTDIDIEQFRPRGRHRVSGRRG